MKYALAISPSDGLRNLEARNKASNTAGVIYFKQMCNQITVINQVILLCQT